MAYIFGGNTGISYEELQQQRKALEARKGQRYAPRDIGSGLSALGHALGTRMASGRLAKAETARQGRADNVFSAFQTILGGGAETTPSQPSETFSSATNATADMPPIEWDGSDLRDGIAATAQSLGVDPIDLATAMSYETAGTFSPTQPGPTTQWGQHRGLIQFGEPQARKYGVDWNDPIGSQLGPDGAVAKYLRDTGVKPGMGLLDIYSAINAGGVGLYNRSDANNGGAPGTVRDKVEKQMAGHRAKALAMFRDYQPRQQTAQAIQPAKPAPSGGVDPRLIQMMGDPSLSPERRNFMQFLLQQHLEANAPAERQREKDAAGRWRHIDDGSLVFPDAEIPAEPGYQMLTGEAAEAVGLDPTKAYNVGPDGKITQIGGGGVNVTVGGGDFKVPPGFMRDPENPASVAPIPGGPQDPNTPTSTNTTRIQEVNSAASAIQESLTAYEKLVNKHGAEVWPGKGRDALSAARRDLQLQMKELFNLGVLNGPDLDLMNELLIDPTSPTTTAEGAIGQMFGSAGVRDRAIANIQQLRGQIERLRKSQTPEGFGTKQDDSDPLGLGDFQ